MLKNFAAALLATSLAVGPVLAQTNDTSKSAAPAPAAQTQAAPAANTAPATTKAPAKHTAKHSKKKNKKMSRTGSAVHQVRHVKSAKSHQANAVRAGSRS